MSPIWMSLPDLTAFFAFPYITEWIFSASRAKYIDWTALVWFSASAPAKAAFRFSLVFGLMGILLLEMLFPWIVRGAGAGPAIRMEAKSPVASDAGGEAGC